MRLLTAGVVVFACMAVEARRAARNERAQRARGGVEPRGDVYPAMRVAYPVGFLFILLAGVRIARWPPPLIAIGWVLFLAAKALKWWAIAALGPAWTFRVIVVPRMALVQSGPYRWMRHPNYAAVVGEFAAVTLIGGALAAGAVVTGVFAALIVRRIRVEESAILDAR